MKALYTLSQMFFIALRPVQNTAPKLDDARARLACFCCTEYTSVGAEQEHGDIARYLAEPIAT